MARRSSTGIAGGRTREPGASRLAGRSRVIEHVALQPASWTAIVFSGLMPRLFPEVLT
jgi:hypothetical protein